MNGAMVRNYCGFDRSLVGVEAFKDYDNPMWDLYDAIFNVPIEEYNPEKKFDCILCTDVIEHFTKEEGRNQIDRWKGWLNPKGGLFISTPSVWIEQGAAGGNKYETHRSLWTEYDFIHKGFTIYRDKKPCKYGHMMIVAEYLNR